MGVRRRQIEGSERIQVPLGERQRVQKKRRRSGHPAIGKDERRPAYVELLRVLDVVQQLGVRLLTVGTRLERGGFGGAGAGNLHHPIRREVLLLGKQLMAHPPVIGRGLETDEQLGSEAANASAIGALHLRIARPVQWILPRFDRDRVGRQRPPKLREPFSKMSAVRTQNIGEFYELDAGVLWSLPEANGVMGLYRR